LPLAHAVGRPAQALNAPAPHVQAFMRPPVYGEQPSVLVASDRASRGIDLPGVGHVVLFDFPRCPLDTSPVP
jgi:Helicase conserved C-terminal domain